MKPRIIFSLFILMVFAFLISGCSSITQAEKEKSVSFKDRTGRIVNVKAKPQRIISLTLGTDEILLDLVEPERIAALTYLASDSGISFVTDKSALVKSKIRSNSAEEILALKPDLVLIADWWGLDMLQTLRDMGVPVYVYKTPYSVNDIRNTIREVGRVVGEPQRAENVIDVFNDKIINVELKAAKIPQTERKRVVALTGKDGFGTKGGLYDDMCKYAGVGNCLSEETGSQFNGLPKERILQLNPDCILVTVWDANGMMKSQTKEEIMSDEGLKPVKAIQNNDIAAISGKCVFCVSQYTADSIEILAKSVYPQYFK
ncbi:MAG: ABC transporter substrate-binding protein [Negativicutes bacterium]|nr:ABC transporter substrate-binding protein [Negativicutes bacterium]